MQIELFMLGRRLLLLGKHIRLLARNKAISSSCAVVNPLELHAPGWTVRSCKFASNLSLSAPTAFTRCSFSRFTLLCERAECCVALPRQKNTPLLMLFPASAFVVGKQASKQHTKRGCGAPSLCNAYLSAAFYSIKCRQCRSRRLQNVD